MNAVWFILVISVVNLWVGYSLALKAGLGPPPSRGIWKDLFYALRGQEGRHGPAGTTQPAAADTGSGEAEDGTGWLVQELILPPDWEEEGEANADQADASTQSSSPAAPAS